MININIPNSNGKRGRQYAKALFEDGTYDLQDFHDTFLELEDPTEYKPALQLVGTWQEWQRLKRDWPTFKSHINEWKEELDVKLKSKAVEQINKLAFSKDNYQANRWLAEEGFHKRTGAGRPSKADRERASRELAEQAAETKADKARILKLVGGN